VARGESLAQLTDIGNMEVRAFVPLKHLPRTVVGEPISVFATDAVYEGRIRALVPTGDVRSQTFEARIDLPASARNSCGQCRGPDSSACLDNCCTPGCPGTSA
jgi:hypothetical protein